MTQTRIGRRSAMGLAAGAGLAMAAGRKAKAADITLNIWTGYPELVPWYKAMGAEYTKAKGTQINILSTSLREHEQKLAAAVPTGTGPDVFDVGQILGITFIEAGLVKPNPAAIDGLLKSAAYRKSSAEQFTTDGKTYGLPMLFSTPAMFWNKAHFKEAGLDGPPKTFQDKMAYAKKLTKFDASGKMTRSGMSLRLSGQGSGIAEKFRFILEPAGGTLIIPNGKGKFRQGYDNDAGRNALKYYIDAVQVDKVDDPKVQHDAAAFVAGNTSMLMREAWVIGEIKEKAANLDYGVAPIPAWGSGPHKTLLQHNGLWVNAKSKNIDAAYDFMLFISSKEASVKLTQLSGWVAARSDVDWSPLLKDIPQYKEFVSPTDGVQFYPEPVMAAWNEIESRLADRLPNAYIDTSLQDPAKLAAFIKAAAAQTDQILKQNDLYGT
ncbi:MAG: extracellular solute-binding protein [Alphaproteobacteria bacterium]|nr:extracellular solute-binding protein [Alphaproteobacteria bacterium]